MKDKLLQLCRRLKKSTRDELLELLDIQEDVLNFALLYLMNEGRIQESNGYYFYIDKQPHKLHGKNKNLANMCQHHPPETIDLIIRCFCTNIASPKVSCLTGLSSSCINNFYYLFRETLYTRQQKELFNLYHLKPQKCRYRIFFNKQAYFYIYNNKLYVTSKPFLGSNEQLFSKHDIQTFKKIYCYLARIESHNKNEFNIHQNLAELIWKRNKIFDELYIDLKNLVNL